MVSEEEDSSVAIQAAQPGAEASDNYGGSLPSRCDSAIGQRRPEQREVIELGLLDVRQSGADGANSRAPEVRVWWAEEGHFALGGIQSEASG